MGSHKSVSRADSHPPGTVTDYVEFTEAAAPSTPASGKAALYVKTDGKIYLKDDAGTESDLTSAGGGGGDLAYLGEHIASGGSTAYLEVSGFATTSRDLRVFFKARSDAASVEAVLMDFNVGSGGTIDTGAGQYEWNLTYDGMSQSALNSISDTAWSDTAGFLPAANAQADHFTVGEMTIIDYASTTRKRSMFALFYHRRTNNHYSVRMQGIWNDSTNAINVFRITPASGNIVDGSILRVYGLG